MIDWKKIQYVLLDMDGTLLDLHFDNHFWHEHLPKVWAEKHKVSFDEARAELVPMFEAEEGTLRWYCLDYWSERLGMNMMDLKQAIKHKVQPRADTMRFLHYVSAANKTIVMVTNAHRDLIAMKFGLTEIGEHFDEIVSSHDYGFAKEQQEFWHRLAEDIHFEKHNAVLIDDNLQVLRTAREYGIEHLLTIKQPDSQKPHREIEDFHALDLFAELMH